MADFYLPKTKHWYSKWWGITILATLCFIFAAAIAFALLIFNYWQLIKSGQGDWLKQQFYSDSFIQAETPEIKALREGLETLDDPYLGSVNADLVIVGFMDFKCPFCRAQMPDLEKLVSKYGYMIKVIVRDFPMESVHAGTARLHEIASCANEQGLYWPFSDYFYINQDVLETLSNEEVDGLMDELGGDKEKMNECLNSGRGRTEVSQDYADGYKFGIKRGTPTFFVNGRMVGEGGLVPYESWETLFANLGLTN